MRLAQPGAGGRAGSEGGMDNWIVANGDKGERALADEQLCARGRRFWTIMILGRVLS